MKDEFRKSMKKVREKITVDAKIKAMEAFWSVCLHRNYLNLLEEELGAKLSIDLIERYIKR